MMDLKLHDTDFVSTHTEHWDAKFVIRHINYELKTLDGFYRKK